MKWYWWIPGIGLCIGLPSILDLPAVRNEKYDIVWTIYQTVCLTTIIAVRGYLAQEHIL